MLKKIKIILYLSMQELKITKNLAFCGLMASLSVILSFFTSFNIGPFLKISFSNYPNRIIEYAFGPAIGAIFGATLDIINCVVRPTGIFHPIFTFISLISGLGSGMLLYKKKITILRIFITQLYLKVFINICLNSIALYFTIGSGIYAMLPMRVLKNLIMAPIDTVILYSILKLIHKFNQSY